MEALRQTRRFEDPDLLIVYVDGMHFGAHRVLALVGVDRTRAKHVLGVAPGPSENYHVATDLLCGIIERGLDPRRLRLFVIDGSKALPTAILELFGSPIPCSAAGRTSCVTSPSGSRGTIERTSRR